MPSYTTSSTVSALINAMEVNASNLAKSSANGTSEERSFMKTLEMGPDVISTGIKLNRLLNVTKQGSPEHVDNDLAMMIGDGGFFAVTATPDHDDKELMFTRAGYFFFDQNGYAKNENGFFIRVAKFDETTTDPGNFIRNNVDTRDLIALNKNDLISPFKATETLNLNFTLPIPTLEEQNTKSTFNKQFSVFDNIGQEHNINMQFERDETNPKKWKIFLNSTENITINDDKNNLLFTADKNNLVNPLFDTSQPFEVEFNNEGKLIKVSSMNQEEVTKTIPKTNAKGEIFYLSNDGNYYTESNLPITTQFTQSTDLNGLPLWEGEDGNGYLSEQEALNANTNIKYKLNPDGSIARAQSQDIDSKLLWEADDGNSYAEDAILPPGVSFKKKTDDATNILYMTTDGLTLTMPEIQNQGKTPQQATDADGNLLWLGDDGNYYKDETTATLAGAVLTQATDADGNLLWLGNDGNYYKDEDDAKASGAALGQARHPDGNLLWLGDDGLYYKDEADANDAGTTLDRAVDSDGNFVWLADDGLYYENEAEATAAGTTLKQATDVDGNPLWVAEDGNYYKDDTDATDAGTILKIPSEEAPVGHIPANIPAKAIAHVFAKIPKMENVKIPHKTALSETVNTVDWISTPLIDATDPLNIITSKTTLTFTWQDGQTSTTSLNFGEPLSANTEFGLSAKYDSFSGKVEQDGNELGKFQSLSVSENGEMTILCDNGTRNQYGKIPVAQFNNPNALQPISGNAFTQTYESGELRLTDGKIITGVVEKSSVDQIRNIMEANNTQKTIGFAMKAYAKQNEVEDMILKTI